MSKISRSFFPNLTMVIFLILLMFMFIFMLMFLSSKSWAYGHDKWVDHEKWWKSYLIHKIINKNDLTFCVVVKDKRLSKENISIEVNTALKLWIRSIDVFFKNGENNQSTIKISEINCDKKNTNPLDIMSVRMVDLFVEVAAEDIFVDLNGYYLPKVYNNHNYAYIKVNLAMLDNYEGKIYKWNDTFMVLKKDNLSKLDKEKYLWEISVNSPTDVATLAKKNNIEYRELFWTTYKTLIHELGHSIGLCDTKDTLFKDQCDVNFRSSDEQKSSVMKDAKYFYLTEDDLDGIESLVKRFKEKSKERIRVRIEDEGKNSILSTILGPI
ncbi:MAG: matrixin family metalloprotease [Oligoflexia bacterium]|nr:matrixin family metalloprotease [Oligoflexia bacterium]